MSRSKPTERILVILATIIYSWAPHPGLTQPGQGTPNPGLTQPGGQGAPNPGSPQAGQVGRHSGLLRPHQSATNPPNLWGAQNKNINTTVQFLKEAPDLPQLPAYSGKSKFLQGCLQPTERGWTNYQMSYLAKEAPLEVKDWYQNVFNSYQWKTIHAGQQSLSANHKDGHVCTVIVNNATEAGYRTQLRVYYNQAPPHGVHPPTASTN